MHGYANLAKRGLSCLPCPDSVWTNGQVFEPVRGGPAM